MNNHPPTPPTLKATIVQMLNTARANIKTQICKAQPDGKSIVLTLPVTIMLEISLRPDQLRAILEAA